MTTAADPRTSILEALTASRAALLDAVDGLSDQALTLARDGDWSAKDLLAHVSAWDELGALDLARAARGHVPFLAAYAHENVDDWNAFLMGGRRAFTLPQVRLEAEEKRGDLREALGSLPAALLDEGGFAQQLTAVIAQHEAGHAAELRAWREAQGT
jgi:hypothetical protein